jgi:complement component 1 Q subcomponent-binding protein
MTADVVLSQKLQEELQYEKTAVTYASEPEFLKSFKEEGLWKIEDVAGQDEVALTRTFGNENIRLVFSIADIQAQEDEPAYDDEEGGEDAASEDEPIHSYGVRVGFSVTKVRPSPIPLT